MDKIQSGILRCTSNFTGRQRDDITESRVELKTTIRPVS